MLSILSMISRWRGSSFPSTFTGHFSSASGITVWFVNASVCEAEALCCFAIRLSWPHVQLWTPLVAFLPLPYSFESCPEACIHIIVWL